MLRIACYSYKPDSVTYALNQMCYRSSDRTAGNKFFDKHSSDNPLVVAPMLGPGRQPIIDFFSHEAIKPQNIYAEKLTVMFFASRKKEGIFAKPAAQ